MDRDSSKRGPRLDEEMKKEVEGQMRSGRPTRAEEWHDPEPQEDENTPDAEEEIESRMEAERGRTESERSEDDAESKGGESATDDATER
jgi:hypothetical protein